MDNTKRHKYMKKIWQVIANILLISILLVGILIAFSLLPINGNYKLFTVMSGSMAQKIPVGSVVAVKPINEYHVGDVVTFNSTNSKDITTHRIYQINKGDAGSTYTTKGDANDAPDLQTISQNQIVGKVYAVLPLLGYVLAYIKTPVGLVLIIIIPSAIIIFEELRKIKNEVSGIVKKRRAKRKAGEDDKTS